MKNQPKVLVTGSHDLAEIVEIHPGQKAFLFGGKLEMLQNVMAFCRQVYHSAFGPEEGERRFRALTLVDAVALWEAGLPDSRSIN